MLKPKCPNCGETLTSAEQKSLALATDTACHQCGSSLFNMRRRNILFSLILTSIVHFIVMEEAALPSFDQALLVLICICAGSVIMDYCAPRIADSSTYNAKEDVSVAGFLCIIIGTLVALAFYHANFALNLGLGAENTNIIASMLLWLLPVGGIYLVDNRKRD